MSRLREQVREFHRTMGCPDRSTPGPIPDERAKRGFAQAEQIALTALRRK